MYPLVDLRKRHNLPENILVIHRPVVPVDAVLVVDCFALRAPAQEVPRRKLARSHCVHFGYFRALRDTGNTLHDPTGSRGVLIAEREAVQPLLPSGLPRDPAAAMLQLPDLRGWKLLPCRTVGADTALLLCFRPDAVTADGKAEDLLVGITDSRLSDNGSYQALLPEEFS